MCDRTFRSPKPKAITMMQGFVNQRCEATIRLALTLDNRIGSHWKRAKLLHLYRHGVECESNIGQAF